MRVMDLKFISNVAMQNVCISSAQEDQAVDERGFLLRGEGVSNLLLDG
jgi:hypothetical protein